MFERIFIKSGSNASEPFLSIEDLVDMMFYYNEVHIQISQFELKQLLEVFGEDILYELITSKRLIIHPCCQHVGTSRYNNLESVGIFSHNFSSIDSLLFNFHKETINNSESNKNFADRFSKVLDIYKYPSGIQESLYKDIENSDLLSRATQVFIKQYYPLYQGVEDIKINAELSETSFMKLYNINGNLRIEELNNYHKRNGYKGEFSYSTILLSIGETHLDCYFASEYSAEIITNLQWGEVYKLRINESINNTCKSQTNIDHFHEMVANDYISPGRSFKNNMISPREILDLLTSTNSIKFREWLQDLPQDASLSNEVYKKEIQNKNSNKSWTKVTRILGSIISGNINPIAGIGYTLLDSMVGDKLINGWQPSIFVDNVLNKSNFKK